MMKQQRDFCEVNRVLMHVLDTALAYLVHHDIEFKKYCLQTAAWGGVARLQELVLELSDPFSTPVNECLEACATAREQMPTENVNYPQYPVAEASFIKLAERVDQIRESNPSLKDCIVGKDLACGRKFANLKKLASRA